MNVFCDIVENLGMIMFYDLEFIELVPQYEE